MDSVYSRNAPILATLIDHHAQINPATPIYVFPSSNDTCSRISHYEFSRACERVGHLVQPNTINLQEEVVGIIGDCDTLVYQTVVAGCVCRGLVVFPLSPRNSPAAIAHLISEVSIKRVLVSKASFTTLTSDINHHLAEHNNRVFFEDIPSLPDIYPYLAQETVPEVIQPMQLPKRRSFAYGVEVYMHSSGSTGMPKAIGYSHQFLTKAQYMRSFTEFTDNPNNILISTAMLPGFHCMGFFWQLLYPLVTGKPVAIFAPRHPSPPTIPTPSVLLESFIQSRVKAAFVVPAFLEAWLHQPASVTFLSSMDVIGFGGAPLALEVGNALSQSGVRIVPVYGLTEAGSATKFLGSTQAAHDWAWLQFAKNASIRWVDQGDGLHELQLITNKSFGLARENLPDVPGYATRDLWVKHPTQDLWRPVGRLDDVIVMANGEKAMPGPLEGAVVSSKLVQGALAFGRERSQLGILVELSTSIPKTDREDFADLRNNIWPCLEAVHRQVPTFARIYKEMIIFTDPSKPLIRTPKGNVNRKATLAAYALEIANLYATLDHHANHGGVPPPHAWNEECIRQWLFALVEKLAKDDRLDANKDIFSIGFDSLSATYLRNSIISTLRVAHPGDSRWTTGIPQEFAYMYPTVNKMASALLTMIETSELTPALSISRPQAITAMIDKYATDIPAISASPDSCRKTPGIVVVITGTTGGLGSEVLAKLLRDDAVAHIYALNRYSSKGDLKTRQVNMFRMRNMDTDHVLSSKLTLVACDVSDANCGLSESLYVEIRDSLDVVIHNAWTLDFNLALPAFESHIKATRHLVNLVCASPRAASVRLLFTSSIAAAQGWNPTSGPCPESSVSDPSTAVGTGYGESKYVAEQILLRARQQGIQTTSFRIEQVTGSTESGVWSLTDWVPLMIKSCANVGQLPSTAGMVAWISSASVSQLLVDAAALTVNRDLGALVNVAHPNPTAFDSVMQAINDALVEESVISAPLPTVSFTTWVNQIKKLSFRPSAHELDTIPAIKLISFFRKASVTSGGGVNALGVIEMIVDNACDISPGFRFQDPFDERAALEWVRYWKSHGLFRAP